WQAGLAVASHARDARNAYGERRRAERSAVCALNTAALRAEPDALHQTRTRRDRGSLHAPRLHSFVQTRRGCVRSWRLLARRILLPLSRFEVRLCRPRISK